MRQIAIPLFPRVTALDAIGPYEVLQRLPDFEVIFVGSAVGEVRTENGFLGLSIDAILDDVPTPDVIVVPGGIGSRAAMKDEHLLAWLRGAHQASTYTTSVCTGSLILGAAGLLDGLTATTHFSAYRTLEATGATPVAQRVVEHLDQRILTAAGVSSGIDMALRLVELLVDPVAAQAMQLMIEYDPQPPFDSGSWEKASEVVRQRVGEYAQLRD